mgnify:CR=1 FL=1|tara:strand:- start:102 stop:524 length:423 start_codon:yes stop_codon:yes gene_type:complete
MTKKIELLAAVTMTSFPKIVENPGSRPAEAWRAEAATEFMGEILMVADIDAKPNSKVKVKGQNQPRFEVEIAEVERRVFVMTAKERAGNGKMTELAKRRIGMFGKIEEDLSGVLVDAMAANEAAAAKADEKEVAAENEEA